MNIQLCILNAEGIILEHNNSLIQIWQKTAYRHGLSIPDDFFENLLSAGFDHRNKVLNQYPHLAKIEDEVLKNHGQQSSQINPEIVEVLDFLQSQNIKIAIVSDSSRKEILSRIEKIMNRYDIPTLVCSNEVLNGKPSPDAYLKIASLSGVKPANTLVIEDSRNGCYSAHLAFMRCVFYQHSLPLSERLFKYSYRQITQLSDIMDIIRDENDPKVIFYSSKSKAIISR